MKNKLLALKLNENSTKEKWLKIGVTGGWKGHWAGEFELDESSYNEMIANAIARGIDIVTDYEHSTIFNPDKAPAAGWTSVEPLHLKVDNGNLYAQIEWTAIASAHILAKEYKFLSPVFVPNTIDHVTGNNIGWTLHSLALTNTPFLSELGAITNKLNQSKEKNDMGLQEDLNKANADLTAANSAITAKDTEINKLKTELEDANKKEAEMMVDVAVTDGKITAKQKDWALKYALSDKEGFTKFLEDAIAVNPDGEMFANKGNSAGTPVVMDMSKI